MPKSKKVLNSKANTCQHNFHSILKCYLCHSLLCDVPYPVTTLFPFLQYSLSNTASSFDVFLSRHRTCWCTNHEIAFLHICSLLHSLFSGVFMTVFSKSVSFMTNTVLREEQEIKIVLCICYISIYSISVSSWLHIFFEQKFRGLQREKILCDLLAFRKASTFSTTVHHAANSCSPKFVLLCLRLMSVGDKKWKW